MDRKTIKVYLNVEEDQFQIHSTKAENGLILVDTSKVIQFYKSDLKNELPKTGIFSKHSVDFDFLTMPLKYRPSQKDVPNQLNANLNGAVYLGYRTDKYNVNYIKNPLGKSKRNINHFGFSFGGFVGFGNTAITPTTSNNYLTTEYDGLVLTKGLAGIFAINNFTLGLSIGADHLLDKNQNYWIYNTKPWYGLAFGLNLN
ncbi:MAG: hypothetical protein V4683_10825 [Bacteroidota bacterium]